MSGQHKLYHFEVTPPAGAWDKIAAELDGSELSASYPSLLYHTAITPPVNAWHNITAALDDARWEEKFGNVLIGAAVAPPPATWERITASLNESTTVHIESRKPVPLFRYAAAAAVIGLLFWGGLQLFSGKKEQGGIASADNLVKAAEVESQRVGNNPVAGDDETAANDTRRDEERINDAALENRPRTYAALDRRTTQSKIRNASNYYFGVNDGSSHTDGASPAADIANRYVLLMTPDGNFIRMSTKLKDIVCCVSGEEDDKECVDQMQKLRNKIADPSRTHSPGNVMDILNMAQSLQGNL